MPNVWLSDKLDLQPLRLTMWLKLNFEKDTLNTNVWKLVTQNPVVSNLSGNYMLYDDVPNHDGRNNVLNTLSAVISERRCTDISTTSSHASVSIQTMHITLHAPACCNVTKFIPTTFTVCPPASSSTVTCNKVRAWIWYAFFWKPDGHIFLVN